MHEECERITAEVAPSFLLNTIVDERGRAVGCYAGDWRAAHRLACTEFAETHTIKIPEKRLLVVAGCGGTPYDINLIQAHKALDMATHACTDGGTIILLAECADGLGQSDFLKWFEAENSNDLAEKLCEKYQVNGQTAWSLLRKAEKFNIQIVTSLAESETRPMRLHKARDFNEALPKIDLEKTGYILPFGAKFLVRIGR